MVPRSSVRFPRALVVESVDSDTADLAPATVELLSALRAAASSTDATTKLKALRPYLNPRRIGMVIAATDELHEARVRRLLEGLDGALADHDHVAVVTGAALMPAIEARALADGFRFEDRLAQRVVGLDLLSSVASR
jgi:hypothetical protein